MKNKFLLLICCGFFNSLAFSQEIKDRNSISAQEQFKNNLGEFKIHFNENKNQFLKFGISSQVWLRWLENNPGSQVNGSADNEVIDASLRRMRLVMQGQLIKNYFVFIQFGVNNQSFISGGGTGTGPNGQGKKPGMFFLDAYNELAIVPSTKKSDFSLYLGAGLHAWNGVSRFTNASTTKLLMADLPVFNFPNIEISDQFSRQFGLFIHGDFYGINYRASINKPFATDKVPEIGKMAVENNGNSKLSYSFYGMYQFLDKETTTTSFLPGTYIGSKKVFTIGSGFYFNKDAMLEQPKANHFIKHNQFNFGIDAFLELPLGTKAKEMSLNVYSVYYYNDFGPNYLRISSIMNPATKDEQYTSKTALEGFGNAKYLTGSGSIWYTQLGFVLPKFSNKIKVQPFAAYHLKDLNGLNETAHFYDVGTNVFLFSQNAKLAVQYSSRPLFDKDSRKVFDRKSEVILSLQVAF